MTAVRPGVPAPFRDTANSLISGPTGHTWSVLDNDLSGSESGRQRDVRQAHDAAAVKS